MQTSGPAATSPGSPLDFTELGTLADQLRTRSSDRPARNFVIGISGIEAAGKSTAAAELAALLCNSAEVIVIEGDAFSRSRAQRNANADPVQGYLDDAYDYGYLCHAVLEPLRSNQVRRLEFDSLEPTTDVITRRRLDFSPPGIAIVEGVLLFRAPVLDLLDYAIWIDLEFSESRSRAARRPRDLAYYPDSQAILDRYDTRFHPAQRVHLAADPIGHADAILRRP